MAEFDVDLGADRLEGRVHVVRVDRIRVRRLNPPKVVNRAGQQPQHAAGALEGTEGRGLLGQHFKQLGVERIAACEPVAELWVGGIRGQCVAVGVPHLGVARDHRLRRFQIDRFEKAGPQNVGRLVFLGGVQRRGASHGDAFRLGHGGGGALVLIFICVAGLVVLADRKGVNECDLRRGGHGLEEVVNEGGELLGRVRKRALHLAEVDGNLVEQNQRGLAAE